jgi:predicted ferric reductase
MTVTPLSVGPSLGSLCVLDHRSCSSLEHQHWKVKAVPEHIADNAIRLTLPNRRIRWSPGQHVFLTLPEIPRMPFESHPFSIASVQDDKHQGLVFTIRAMGGFTLLKTRENCYGPR